MNRHTITAGIGLMLAALLLPLRTAAAEPVRRSFDIVTGPAAGSHFPVGELIARIVSHPPGLARCEKAGVCAPAGIIVSARTSDGAVANVLAVNDGSAASGLAQAPVVAEAVAGRGAFRKAGRQTHIRVMADLFAEPVQLVARRGIDSPAKLKGKRVGLGGAGDDVVAAQILSGLRVVAVRGDSAEVSAAKLRNGRIAAFVVIGDVPVAGDLVSQGVAHLVPIGGKLRARLIARVPGLVADTVSWRGTGPIETVAVRTLWIANDRTPAATVYGLVRALYDPANRAMLAQGPRPATDIQLGTHAGLTIAPLHPGAMRFYRETGRLPPPSRH